MWETPAKTLVGLLAAWGAGIAWPARADQASSGQAPQAVDEGDATAHIEDLTAEFKRLGDWEDQYQIIDRAIEHAWSRNGWDSEADLFARNMIREVARIPPWEFDRRMETMVDSVGDRWGLPPPQRAKFRATMYREALGMLWENGSMLMKQSREYVGMRVRGEPFTAETVARWVRESEELAADMGVRAARVVEELEGSIDDRHREVFRRDLESFDRRMTYVEELRREWAEGGWKPEHWGLDKDPVQLGAGLPEQPATEFSAAQRAAMERFGIKSKPHSDFDPSTWEAYLRAFIALYGLDAGQAAAAESILVEVLDRAISYLRVRAEGLVEIPANDRPTAEEFAPIRTLFDELRARLSRIPTAAQRRRVEHEAVPEQ